jgi:DNA-binding PadR family transcriptional regulator
MTTTYALLGILGRQPSYGYELKRDYDFYFGRQKPLAFGQVYATLSRFLRDQKISVQATEQGGGPERKLYAITDMGRTDLESWLIIPEKLHPDMQTVLFIKVVTAILLNKEPDMFLDAQRAAILARMREITRLRHEGDLAQLLQADYALFHLDADLLWIDLTVARLQELKKEIQTYDLPHG